MKACKKCGKQIPVRLKIDGKVRNLKGRKYCFDCSPFGKHNTKQLDGKLKIKKCAGCGKDFCTKKQKYCGTCNWRIRREIKSKKLYAMVGTACWFCGYDKGYEAIAVLDFHHVNPLTKKANVSSREIAMAKWNTLIEEAKKCVVLCARCHREQQIGIITEDEIKKIYEFKWKQILIDTCEPIIRERKRRAIKICQVCGSQHKRWKYCSIKCSAAGHRKFNISKKDLEEMINQRSMESIGREFGVTGNTIKKRCKKLGIGKYGSVAQLAGASES